MPYPNFAGGTDPIQGYGDRWKILFAGAWAATDTWTVSIASSSGNVTFGVGNLHALTPTVCFTYKNRVYLGMGTQVNYSENFDPTAFEEQSPGAGFLRYLTNFGSQDVIGALSQLQGRLAIFGRRSIQLWTTDADPNNFAIAQTLDNIGTAAPLSVQNIGDFDVYFLDDTGVRSLRVMEVTLNAMIDDIGSPIDDFVRAALLTNAASTAVSIVEPTNKQYWLYLGGNIYCLSRFRTSKVSAWSTFLPKDQAGTTFAPKKMVVLNGRVYIRGTAGGSDYLYLYGDADNTTYDANTPVTVQLPWLAGGGKSNLPDTTKQGVGCSAVWQGNWKLQVSFDPQSNTFKTVIPARGSAATPNALTDSTYDLGKYSIPGMFGTHFSFLATSTPAASKSPAILSSITLRWNDAGKQ